MERTACRMVTLKINPVKLQSTLLNNPPPILRPAPKLIAEAIIGNMEYNKSLTALL